MIFSQRMLIASIVAGILTMSTIVRSFNLSPQPNLVLREPVGSGSEERPLDERISSYFGFSINVRTNSILIGAPRATSYLPSQRDIASPGVIYRCPLSGSSSPECAPFTFEAGGNRLGGNDKNYFTGEWRDNQWLGAAIDGGADDTDRFVVCAPRMHTHEDLQGLEIELNPGVCYWTPNTTEAVGPLDVRKINAMVLKRERMHAPPKGAPDHSNVYYRMLAEQGFSVHVTEAAGNGDESEILLGAPGVSNWKGTIVRYKRQKRDHGGGIVRRDLSTVAADEYEEEVPHPLDFSSGALQDGSYFGYAIDSGRFRGPGVALLYVASAPQSNEQQGEVFVFDIVEANTMYGGGIKAVQVFDRLQADQMGEYFGYALAAGDWNADGWTDLAVGAPFYKGGTSGADAYETGAVYVYGNVAGKLVLQSRLVADRLYNGARFGTTVARMGDVNRDGFPDLAVGAPYEEGNGAVYVYLGAAGGLVDKPSQRLSAALADVNVARQPMMFGHGLAKGADMDANRYPDLAIGAPGIDAVYVYRAYPVANVRAYIQPLSSEIDINDRTMDFRACWSVGSAEPLRRMPTLEFEIRMDQTHGRVTTTDPAARNVIRFQAQGAEREQCKEFRVNVRYVAHDVFRALQFDLQFEVAQQDKVPVGGGAAGADGAALTEFCEHCVAVDPREKRAGGVKVVFSTGCKSTRCIADLVLTSAVREPLPYIVGSTTSLVIDYYIDNIGETAFLPELNITTPANVKFTKTPPSCREIIHHHQRAAGAADQNAALHGNTLACDLSSGGLRPLRNGERTTMRIHLDTTQLQATGSGQLPAEVAVRAHVTSSGDESNDADNVHALGIALREFSTVEVAGRSSMEFVSLETVGELGVMNVTHSAEVRNAGPSAFGTAVLVVRIPQTYADPWTLEKREIFDWQSSNILCTYDNRHIPVQWISQQGSIILKDDLTTAAPPPAWHDLETLNANNPDSHYRRRRRDSLQTTVIHTEANTGAASDAATVYTMKKYTLIDSEPLSYLPVNRTILFSCDDPSVACVNARFIVPNFRTGSHSPAIRIRFNMSLDLSVINQIVDDVHDIFVVQTLITVQRPGDPTLGQSVALVPTFPFTVISKYAVHSVPIWVYILSALLGLLILVGIAYAMHHYGFFKRHQKEEMEQIKRKSQALSLQREDGADD